MKAEQYRCSIPILMIGFNRPDNIRQAFEKVRDVQPYKLYVAIDGARAEKEGEEQLVAETKNVIEQVDWDCEVLYKYNKTNLGAEVTISSALRWICEQEEYFIMLEDDIVAPPSFFKFQEEMLIKYKDYANVKLVSGSNFTPIPTPNGEDYFFSRYGHTGGGWGSWKRVWQNFDLNIEVKKEHCTLEFCKSISCCDEEARATQKTYKYLRKRGVGNCTWDYISSYKCSVAGMISIVPRVNLTTNIGVIGLHASGRTALHFLPYDKNFIVKKHPAEIKIWEEYDIYHFHHHFPKPANIVVRGCKYLQRLIKNICKGRDSK